MQVFQAYSKIRLEIGKNLGVGKSIMLFDILYNKTFNVVEKIHFCQISLDYKYFPQTGFVLKSQQLPPSYRLASKSSIKFGLRTS